MDSSPFNRLSAELRNIIFGLALRADEPFELSAEKEDKKTLAEPALTRTCKQIRAETSLMFYAENKFHIDLRCPDDFDAIEDLLSGFSKKLGHARARLSKVSQPKLQIIGTVTVLVEVLELLPLIWRDMTPELVLQLEKLQELIDDIKQLGLRYKIRTTRVRDYHGSQWFAMHYREFIKMFEAEGWEVEEEVLEYEAFDEKVLEGEMTEDEDDEDDTDESPDEEASMAGNDVDTIAGMDE